MENANYEEEIKNLEIYNTLADIKNAYVKMEEIEKKIKEMKELSKRYKNVMQKTIEQWEKRKE